jgi:ATP-dependent DNA helicase RecQ
MKINSEHYLINSKPLEEGNPEKVALVTTKLSGDTPLYCFVEDLLWLYNSSLSGLIALNNYKIVIVNNDLFNAYYPDSKYSTEEIESRSKLFDADSDNLIQTFYSEMNRVNDRLYVVYNDISSVSAELVNISDYLEPDMNLDTNSDLIIQIPDEFDFLTLTDTVLSILKNGIRKVSVLEETIRDNQQINHLQKILTQLGIEIIYRGFDPLAGNKGIDKLDRYKEILRRKNPDYDFYNIKLYEDPYENTNLIDVNQSVIVDTIVKNVELARNFESFRDIFVTAPTGAGKSVMFQIPAIFLAEDHDLITIVVTPLIGLMDDQVENIRSMTDKAATINSGYTPAEKEDTLKRVKDGLVSILYLSPESLLSNTDITNLIGDRQIGLVVIDEAHTVATWGKSFRPDYWYLGDFIYKLRSDKKNPHRFPIATFTATATFSGKDNMYQDILDSLKMTPEKFIGNVKRDDIIFDIRNIEKQHAYQEEKLNKAIESINSLASTGEKILVYTPYTGQVSDLYHKMADKSKVGMYTGRLTSGEKNETLRDIKSGAINVVLATKAFGMGIDINDIKNVYHFAPTGNVTDYVQEIGRVARKPGMTGVAVTDFYKEDLRYVKALHGMSIIKNYQIKGVLQKIIELYRKYDRRNFLVAPEEFAYVFAGQQSTADDIDGKLKTTLLIIKKDFDISSSSNYTPLVFKPRSMFTRSNFMIRDDFLPTLEHSGLLKYFKNRNLPRKMQEVVSTRRNSGPVTTYMPGDIYELDFKTLWESEYKNLSFGDFKRRYYKNELDFDFKFGEMIFKETIVEVDSVNPFRSVKDNFSEFCTALESILGDFQQSNKFFKLEQLVDVLMERTSIEKRYIAEMVAPQIMYLLQKIELNGFHNHSFTNYDSKKDMFYIKNNTFTQRIYILKRAVRGMLSDDNARHVIRYTRSGLSSPEVIAAQFLESLELVASKISEGSNPEFFVRVNSPYAIEKILDNDRYRSKTLRLVNEKHEESCNLMTYFFTQLKNDEERWKFIENYFLGILDDQMEQIKQEISELR